jgi:3',5'-cyclic AMP phosphodiesterase CpdA
VAAQDSITLLHISDMQFGRNHRFGNLGGDDDFDSLFGRLDPDLSELEDEGVIPQLIVVSGDLAEWGMKSEFDDARAFLEKLAERVAVPREKVVIVPGNHDVNRKLCEAYFNECEGDQVTPVEPYARKWRPYLSLFQEFYGDSSDIAFTVEEPWSLWELDDLNLVVAGLNSTIKESHEEDAHYGWVGERQLRRFEQRLKPYIERGWFRLGVVHHNVERGAEGDDENLRDADDLKRIVAPSLNILLHGHTHDGKTG